MLLIPLLTFLCEELAAVAGSGGWISDGSRLRFTRQLYPTQPGSGLQSYLQSHQQSQSLSQLEQLRQLQLLQQQQLLLQQQQQQQQSQISNSQPTVDASTSVDANTNPNLKDGQILNLGEATFIAGLQSDLAEKPLPPTPKPPKEPIKMTPRAVSALQRLPDDKLTSIVKSQSDGKIVMTPEQVKQFKETDPEVLSDLINSGALTKMYSGETDNPVPSNQFSASPLNSNGLAPSQLARVGNNYPQNIGSFPNQYPSPQFGNNPLLGYPQRPSLFPDQTQGAFQSAYPANFGQQNGFAQASQQQFPNAQQFPTAQAQPAVGTCGQPLGGKRVTVQEITLLQSLSIPNIKKTIQQRSGTPISDQQANILKTTPANVVAQKINCGDPSVFTGGPSLQQSQIPQQQNFNNQQQIQNSQQFGGSTCGQPLGGRRVSVKEISLLQTLSISSIKSMIEKQTGFPISDQQAAVLKNNPPQIVAEKINCGDVVALAGGQAPHPQNNPLPQSSSSSRLTSTHTRDEYSGKTLRLPSRSSTPNKSPNQSGRHTNAFRSQRRKLSNVAQTPEAPQNPPFHKNSQSAPAECSPNKSVHVTTEQVEMVQGMDTAGVKKLIKSMMGASLTTGQVRRFKSMSASSVAESINCGNGSEVLEKLRK